MLPSLVDPQGLEGLVEDMADLAGVAAAQAVLALQVNSDRTAALKSIPVNRGAQILLRLRDRHQIIL
jgi:hypothetical protein